MNHTGAMNMTKVRMLDDGKTVEIIGGDYKVRFLASEVDLTDDQLRKLRDGRILKLDSVPMKSVEFKEVKSPALDRDRVGNGSPGPTEAEPFKSLVDAARDAGGTIRALVSALSDVVAEAEALGHSLSMALAEAEHDNDSARESLGQLGVGAGSSCGGSSGQGSGTSPGVGPDMRFVEGVRREITEKVRAVDKDAVVSFGRGSFDGGVFFSDKTRQNEILEALNSGGFVQVDPPRVFDDGVSICFKPFVHASPGSVRPTLHNPETLIPFPKDEFESAMLKYCVANYFLKDENDLVWSGIPERFFVDRIFEYSGRFEDALAAYERNPSSCVTLMVFNISRFPLLYWFVKGVWEAVPFSPKPRPFLPDDESEVTVVRNLQSALKKFGLEDGTLGEPVSLATNAIKFREIDRVHGMIERAWEAVERDVLAGSIPATVDAMSFRFSSGFLEVVNEARKKDAEGS